MNTTKREYKQKADGAIVRHEEVEISVDIPKPDLEARAELAKLSDKALMEIQAMLNIQYRLGFEYGKYRSSPEFLLAASLVPSLETQDNVALDRICRIIPIEEFRAMIRAV